MRIAMSTITILLQPYGHPVVAEYEERIGPVFEEAERSPGFIARAKPVDDKDHLTNFERDWGPWGKFTTPRFYTGGRVTATDSRASTLSLWVDLASIRAFASKGGHRYMVRNQSRWTEHLDWKTYAAWWVDDDTIPTWEEGSARIEYINDHGPSPHAFDFAHPYDEQGRPLKPQEALSPARGEAGRDAS